MPSHKKKKTLFEECHDRDCMPPPDKSITKGVISRRNEHRAHKAWLDKVGEDSVKYLEVPSAQGPSAQGPSAELKHKKTKRRRRKRRNPTKKKKKKPTKKR
jgi:hypothetical protein